MLDPNKPNNSAETPKKPDIPEGWISLAEIFLDHLVNPKEAADEAMRMARYKANQNDTILTQVDGQLVRYISPKFLKALLAKLGNIEVGEEWILLKTFSESVANNLIPIVARQFEIILGEEDALYEQHKAVFSTLDIL